MRELLLCWCNLEFVRNIVWAGDGDSLRLNVGFLVVGSNWSLKGDFAVLRDDLDILRVGRQRLIVHDRPADFLRQLAVRRILRLLVGSSRSGTCVTLIILGVVRLLRAGDSGEHCGAEDERRARKTKTRSECLDAVHTAILLCVPIAYLR